MRSLFAGYGRAFFLFFFTVLLARSEVPALAKLKAAAEAGDPHAQYAFAQHFGIGTPEWANWLRLSAAQGNGRAEDDLAWTLNWQNFATYFPEGALRASHLRTKGSSMREALLIASSAADKGFARSRLMLGMAFANGYLVVRDQTEAYKWLKVAGAGDFMSDIAASGTRDRLLKEMPMKAVEEGEQRAAKYKPGSTVSFVRAQLVLPLLKLTGLASIGGSEVAIINGKRCRVGEDISINLEGLTVLVHLRSIDAGLVSFTLPPDGQLYAIRSGAAATAR